MEPLSFASVLMDGYRRVPTPIKTPTVITKQIVAKF